MGNVKTSRSRADQSNRDVDASQGHTIESQHDKSRETEDTARIG